MVKSLPEIAMRLKRAGKIVSINTNGHLLEQHVDWLVDARIDRLQVSIDAHDAELHDGIRRQRGSFERILRGIEALKARRRDATPGISVCGVLMHENAAHLVDFADRFAEIADAVEIQPLHESPGLLATSAANPITPADRPSIERQLARLGERHAAFADDYYRNFPRFLFDAPSMRHFAVDHCLPMIFNTLTIREDGAYRICRYPLHQNVFATSISEVWNSPARRDLYRSLVREGCGEPCWIRCHIHPSPQPGRVLRRAIDLVGRASRRRDRQRR